MPRTFLALFSLFAIAITLRHTSAQDVTWDVGYANVIVQPYFESDIAFIDTNAPGTPDNSGTRMHEFDWDLEYNPRVWLSQTDGNGGGWRVTYFSFDHDAILSATEGAGFGNLQAHFNMNRDEIVMNVDGTIIARHSLDLDVVDLELFQSVDLGPLGPLGLSMAGGTRYAHMQREYFAFETGGAELISGNHEFDGIGPTMRIEGSTGFLGAIRFFMNGRGSLLFGSESWLIVGETDPGEHNEHPSHYTVLPIVESQMGLELQVDPAGLLVTFRAAMEGQAWIGGGGWNFSYSGAGTEYPDSAGSFGLFGFVISGEIAY